MRGVKKRIRSRGFLRFFFTYSNDGLFQIRLGQVTVFSAQQGQEISPEVARNRRKARKYEETPDSSFDPKLIFIYYYFSAKPRWLKLICNDTNFINKKKTLPVAGNSRNSLNRGGMAIRQNSGGFWILVFVWILSIADSDFAEFLGCGLQIAD